MAATKKTTTKPKATTTTTVTTITKTTTTGGTRVPLTIQSGIENVRQGYGTAKLKSVTALYAVAGTDTNTIAGIPVEVKNSNWIDKAGVLAQKFADDTSLDMSNLAHMRGRDVSLMPNTSWMIDAVLPATWTYNASTAPYLDLYVILSIEYSDVQGLDTERTVGYPVMKEAINQSVTGSANVEIDLGTYDNLLQGKQYVLSEVSMSSGITGTAQFLIVRGFANQKGLQRVIPIKANGIAEQIRGSTYLTKQTYPLALISNVALSSTSVQVNMEMVCSDN